MSNLEKKREEFRKYLDRTGAIDNLTKALIKLYEQKNKPQDSVKFLRNEMCEECHDEDQYQLLAADLEAANKRICELEREISKIKGSLRKSPSEMMLAISTGFEEMTLAASPDAIIRKVLTKELIDKAMELKTVFKGTLLDCIQSSLEYHESPVGAFACDHDAYEVFAELFNPIIEIMHDFTPVDKHPEMNWDESCKIPELDENFVKSVEISCIRNISDYPFASIMTLDHYDEIMKRFAGIVKCMCTGNLKGKFYGLDSIPTAARKSLLDSKILFTNDCPLLKAANVYRFWPNGRGVFINEMQNFYVWCNQTDHLKFFVKESGGNMRAAYELLIEGVSSVCKEIEIIRDQRLGFLTFSPKNLGNTINVTVRIELMKLPKYQDKLDEIACNFNLKLNKFDGDGNDMLYEVTNTKCLGMCEFDTVKEVSDGIVALIKAESELEDKVENECK